jgi:DNA (cytosine-5)-methyltransferase 1
LDLLTPLIAAGYRIHMRKVNAANYGVPQHRKRVIAIGGLV